MSIRSRRRLFRSLLPKTPEARSTGSRASEAPAEATAFSRGLHVDTFEPRLLLSADLIPVAGTIEVPGETDYYAFELTEERRVVFDALTNDGNMTWQLDGPGGQVVGPTGFQSSDGSQGGEVLSLDAGTYTLRVDANGEHTGDYQFRLLNLTNADPIDFGTQLTGTLENAGRETDLFQFNADAGTELFFDAQQLGGGTAYWQLVDPDGATVFGPTSFDTNSDLSRLTVEKTGTYTLLLEGRIYNGADSSYAFTVERVVDETFAAALDQPTFGELTQAGQRHHYDFTLADDTRVYLDHLGAQDDLRATLTGPQGTLFANLDLRALDWANNNHIHDLVAGDYRLSIGGTSDNQGHYGFQILTDASAETVAVGQLVEGTLTDQGFEAQTLRRASDAPIDADPGGMVRFREGGPAIYTDNVAELNADAFTIEAWVRPSEDRLYDVLAMRTSSSAWNDGFGLFLDGAGNVVFYINQWNDNSQRVSTPLAQDTWSHVAASYEEGSLKLYINGELMAENVITATVRHADVPLWLGESNGGYHFRGDMDEARFWTTARSEAEIAASYDQALTGTEAGLLLNLGFDESATDALANRVAGGPGARFEAGPGRETRIFKLSANGGDRLVVDTYRVGSAYTRIFGPSGQLVQGPDTFNDLTPFVVPDDGDYTILIEGYVYEGAARPFSFVAVPESTQALTLEVDERIDGQIGALGETDVYSFTLAEDATLYFDQLSDRSDMTWTLIGPRGTEVSGRRFDQSDGWDVGYNPLIDLIAGDYTLHIDGSGVATGDYSFRLFDIANAAVIAYADPDDADDKVSATLDPGNAMAAFRADRRTRAISVALQRISNDGWLKVIDPTGQLVYNSYLSSFGTQTLSQWMADYLILVEGLQFASPTNPTTVRIRFNYTGNTPPAPLEGIGYVLGDVVAETISAAGEVDRYLFTVTEATQVYFDMLGYGAGTTYWSLTGPQGGIINDRGFWSSDSYDFGAGNPLISLVPGTYQIAVRKDASETGSLLPSGCWNSATALSSRSTRHSPVPCHRAPRPISTALR
jgi:hypothetical protein